MLSASQSLEWDATMVAKSELQAFTGNVPSKSNNLLKLMNIPKIVLE